MRRRVAFVQGRRVYVDLDEGVASICGRQHTDRFPVDQIESRIALYEQLSARKTGAFYAASLAAARKLGDLAAQLQAEAA